MPGQRQPIELIQAKGAKHLTKAEITARQASEIKPITDNIIPPDYLTKRQKAAFGKIAAQLQALKIMGETDIDALARYVIASEFYVTAVKKLRSAEVKQDPKLFEMWAKIQEQYFKQCRACANDLGLTISSRCRLVVPKTEETPKENKFKKFEKAAGANE